MTKPMEAVNYAAIGSLIFCAVFVLMLGFWMAYPYDVMRVNSLTVLGPNVEIEAATTGHPAVFGPQVEAGEYLEYILDYCKAKQYENLRASVHLSFRDGVTYNLPVESGPLSSGCRREYFILKVPAIPEGKYHLEMLREYPVNRLRTIEVSAISQVFKVSAARRFTEMLKKQLPSVIHEPAIREEIQKIP